MALLARRVHGARAVRAARGSLVPGPSLASLASPTLPLQVRGAEQPVRLPHPVPPHMRGPAAAAAADTIDSTTTAAAADCGPAAAPSAIRPPKLSTTSSTAPTTSQPKHCSRDTNNTANTAACRC